MSQLVINEAQDNGFQDGFINDVTFLYACIHTAKTKYKSEELEYSVKIVVDEDTADAFQEAFPKNGVKKVKTADFEGTFGCAAPSPDEKNQYILTLKIDAADRNGVLHAQDSFKRPKVFVPSENGVKDITMETLVSNGSRGDLNFWISSSEFGKFPKLAAILVKELIPYEKKENVGSAWGSVEGGAPQAENPFEGQSKEDQPDNDTDGDDTPF